MNTMNKEPERQEIEALLPWHAAGTLSRRDADRVEQALAGDRELARRFDIVREELSETIHLNESLGAPSARAMEKLFAAIEAEGVRTPSRRASFDFAGRISDFLAGFAPRTLAWSAAAAALAIVVQAGVITAVAVKERGAPANYETASAPQASPTAHLRWSVLPRKQVRPTSPISLAPTWRRWSTGRRRAASTALRLPEAACRGMRSVRLSSGCRSSPKS